MGCTLDIIIDSTVRMVSKDAKARYEKPLALRSSRTRQNDHATLETAGPKKRTTSGVSANAMLGPSVRAMMGKLWQDTSYRAM